MVAQAPAGQRVAARERMRPPIRSALVSILAGGLAFWWPAAASAVTVDQIVALSKAGVSEAVILTVIDRDRTILSIEPDQVVALKREGLSDTVITAMLKSGRDEGDQAARAVSSDQAAAILPTLSPYPEVAIVGHGPDRPNTVHTEDLYAGFRDGISLPAATPYGYPYGVPHASAYAVPFVGVYGGAPYARAFGARTAARTAARAKAGPRNDRVTCVAQTSAGRGAGPTSVSECPAALQSARSR